MQFIIKGEPVPKGRPKLTSFGGHARAYTPAKTREAEQNIRAQIVQQLPKGFMPMQGAIAMRAVFVLTKPKSVKRIYPSVKPDADNLLKALLDAMNTVVFRDDAQIVHITATKEYGNPETIIDMEEMV